LTNKPSENRWRARRATLSLPPQKGKLRAGKEKCRQFFNLFKIIYFAIKFLKYKILRIIYAENYKFIKSVFKL